MDKNSLWAEGLRRFRKNKGAAAGLVVFLLICAACLFAPLLTRYTYTEINVQNHFSNPSLQHIFGTDNLGRDLFTRILYGGRTTLRISLLAAFLAAAAGSVIGLTAGYFGGRVDFYISRFVDMAAAIPAFLLAIVTEIALGWGKGNFLYAVAISATPQFARLVRASVMSVMSSEYIEAARALGVGHLRIIAGHVLPNTASPILVNLTGAIADAILTCTILGYLGIGINPPAPEWGSLVYAAKDSMLGKPMMMVFPALAVTSCIIAVNFFGAGLRDAFDPAGIS